MKHSIFSNLLPDKLLSISRSPTPHSFYHTQTEERNINHVKRGFAYDNISIEENYDEDALPNVLIDQTPNADTKVSIDSKIEIFVNTYIGEEEE